MNILYIANHDSGGADDEGAITHAFESLGHSVQRLREYKGHTAHRVCRVFTPDLLLFHKWGNTEELQKFKGICPRVFWYFDLVDWPSDTTLNSRCESRIGWMFRVSPHVEVGFCTDGDWVAKDQSGKLVWLTQGADERVVGRPPITNTLGQLLPSALLTCIDKGGGKDRIEFVEWIKNLLGPKLQHIRSGLYRESLREAIYKTKIVVCPDSPVTDRYWSNRVYNAAGFGGLVLHPYCEQLTKHYDRTEVAYYKDRDQLKWLIDQFLTGDFHIRCSMANAALERTKREHLYRHRCETLLATVKARCS